ncbi:MAG TPA: hypothetical protein VHV10_02790 [Ktedonobacteraceae bacterium]|jgi:hypothetical protein|nr:hypothetical protein [Ktedonobacteraceae bacterium]
MADETITITGGPEVMFAVAQVPVKAMAAAMPVFEEVANSTLSDATAAAPYDPNHKGSEPHLKDTGRVEKIENGYSVTFGDDSEEIGYSMFTELGHMSRAGNHVAAQPYLYPSFLLGASELEGKLEDILP